MKVSGNVTTSKPISLSKATKVLSKFVSAETGASQAVSAYLRRASAAFTELIQFHKDPKQKKQQKSSEYADNAEGSFRETENEAVPGEPEREVVYVGADSDTARKKRKKKREKGMVEAEGRGREDACNMMIENETRKEEKKKRKRSGETVRSLQEESKDRRDKKRRRKKGDE